MCGRAHSGDIAGRHRGERVRAHGGNIAGRHRGEQVRGERKLAPDQRTTAQHMFRMMQAIPHHTLTGLHRSKFPDQICNCVLFQPTACKRMRS